MILHLFGWNDMSLVPSIYASSIRFFCCSFLSVMSLILPLYILQPHLVLDVTHSGRSFIKMSNNSGLSTVPLRHTAHSFTLSDVTPSTMTCMLWLVSQESLYPSMICSSDTIKSKFVNTCWCGTLSETFGKSRTIKFRLPLSMDCVNPWAKVTT